MGKTCINCQKTFEIKERDRAFYEGFKVAGHYLPNPTHCPDCRAQRRWAARNQTTLYQRKCDLTGEPMVSLYSPDSPHVVYKESSWWSDEWNALDYGREFDFDRPFFEQLHELLLAVPRRGMMQDGTNENSEYITFGMSNKNCYMCFACFNSEDLFYMEHNGFCKDSADCFVCLESELIYECVDSQKMYQCGWCQDCVSCQNSYLLEDCRNCRNCIACKGLRNKDYHIYNQPVSPEEFEAFKSKLLAGGINEERARFNRWKLQIPSHYTHNSNVDNCTGDYLENAQNCFDSYDLLWGAVDCSYCQVAGWKGKDMFDCSMTGKESELLYEMHASINSHHCAFNSFCRYGSDIFYSDCMNSCQNCFGCTGLNHKSYCILNKQYTKEEYEALLPRIIEHMKKTGEWGENRPISISTFPYNDTEAQVFHPLTRDEAMTKGYIWRDAERPKPSGSGKGVLQCETCAGAYRIIAQETALYKKLGLPQPSECPDCRRVARRRQRNPFRMWDRQCAKCDAALRSSYEPGNPQKIYCTNCYLAEVY